MNETNIRKLVPEPDARFFRGKAAYTHHNHWPKHALALATSRTAHHKPTHHTMLQSPISQPSQGLDRQHASSVRAHTTQAPAAPPSRPPRLNI